MKALFAAILLSTQVLAAPMPLTDYETVAASQTAQVLGPHTVGKTGHTLSRLIIIPANLNPGLVTIIDGNVSIPVFIGGAASITELKPIVVEINALSKVATTPGWKVTTGADVSVLAVGRFY